VLKIYEKIYESDLYNSEEIIEANINTNNTNLTNNNLNRTTIIRLSGSNYTNEGKVLYIPIAICLWSYVSNTEFFKSILEEIYRSIYNNRSNFNRSSCNNDSILNCIICNSNNNINTVNLNHQSNKQSQYYLPIASIFPSFKLRDYFNCELLNYFLFLANIVKPDGYTNLKLNLSK